MPCRSVRVSHEISVSSEWSDMKTWSSLDHLFVTLCWWVGISLGRARTSPTSATASCEQFDCIVVVTVVVYIEYCDFAPGTFDLHDNDVSGWEV